MIPAIVGLVLVAFFLSQTSSISLLVLRPSQRLRGKIEELDKIRDIIKKALATRENKQT